MIFYWSLIDNKCPQIFWALLCIQADLNNAILWMITTCSLILKSLSPFTSPLRIVPSSWITISLTVTFMFHYYFSSLARSRYLSLFFSLLFSLSGPPGRQSTLFGSFSFFCWLCQGLVDWEKSVIYLCLKIPEKFWCLILQDGFWVMHTHMLV